MIDRPATDRLASGMTHGGPAVLKVGGGVQVAETIDM
jgi:hypothetical protein